MIREILSPHNRTIWAALCLFCTMLLATALVMQYVFDMQPCVMCVYQRAGIAIAALFFLLPALRPGAFTCALGILGSTVTLAKTSLISITHASEQRGDSLFGSCGFIPEFPTSLPLHEILPWLFAPTGPCGAIHFQLLGMTTPELLLICMGLMLAANSYAVFNYNKKGKQS